jgi:hypothetical protein
MKNAHHRFGWLSYTKRTEKTNTHFRVRVDRFIGEVSENGREAKAHLISMIGGDTQVAALSGAIFLGDRFIIEGPELDPIQVSFGRNAQCLKGSLSLAGRAKPLRHLIGISDEFATASGASDTTRTILAHGGQDFVWASLAQIHGLPGVPEWAEWFCLQIQKRRLITPVLGIGCDPIVIKGSKQQFLVWLNRGVARGELRFPSESGQVEWPRTDLRHIFQYEGQA